MLKPFATAFLTLSITTAGYCVASTFKGEAVLKNRDGADTGRAFIRETPSGVVLVTISATGLPQGWHGLHIHETGECNPETGFKSAGGHLARNQKHGVLTKGGPHPGDLPNQMVKEGGTLVAEIYAPDTLKLTKEGPGAVFDDDGSAFVIHSGRDDYTSQPSGAAGERIVCGVIEAR